MAMNSSQDQGHSQEKMDASTQRHQSSEMPPCSFRLFPSPWVSAERCVHPPPPTHTHWGGLRVWVSAITQRVTWQVPGHHLLDTIDTCSEPRPAPHCLYAARSGLAGAVPWTPLCRQLLSCPTFALRHSPPTAGHTLERWAHRTQTSRWTQDAQLPGPGSAGEPLCPTAHMDDQAESLACGFSKRKGAMLPESVSARPVGPTQ